tara:strand:+ start:219 stop:383 length:165 start_codon:yes stop_codon:yes gene_type:complete
MIDKLLKLLKNFMKTSDRIDEKGRKILVVEDVDPDYRTADHWDEIREIERKDGN